MLVISQQAWVTSDTDTLAHHVEHLVSLVRRRQLEPVEELLVLLPHGTVEAEPVAADQLWSALGSIASVQGVMLAGSAVVGSSEETSTVGFLLSANGEPLLTTAKVSPDLVTGISDNATSALGQPAEFKTAVTGFGQVGILPGEDILSPHLTRALVWAGAEIILNPVAEVSDHLFPGRETARVARAWENTAFVAVASATGGALGSPACSRLVDFNGYSTVAEGDADIFIPDLDIERLRRRRSAIVAVQPLHLRANLYADGYDKLIAARPEPLGKPPKNRVEWIAEGQRRKALTPPSDKPGRIEQYDVLLTQTVSKIIQRTDDAVALRRENTEHAMTLAGRMAVSPGIKLVVMGEFFMHGQGGHGFRSPVTLQRLAIRYPGPELELLQDFALKHKTYVCGSTFEIDDKLPGHVFNSAFILNDTGQLIHRYRKIQCADVWGSLPDTTPSSIYERYLDTYGYDFLFPIADTPIGRLGTMVCFDQAHPEIARMLTKYGAEIIVHPSSEGHGSGRDGWDAARATRAFENTAYVVSAMPGGEYFNPSSGALPTTQMRGHSRIINFDGKVLGVADGPGACILTGTIDLKALRRARANAMTNLPLWDDPEVYAHAYAGDVGLPNNLWGDDPMENPYVGLGPLKERIKSFYERGIFVRPAGMDGDAVPPSSKVYGPALKPKAKPKESTRLADQERLDGESIQI
ncbi:MAG: nitrilase-related carbon-nitrogen hydrolase [Pseudomonadota bacterium]